MLFARYVTRTLRGPLSGFASMCLLALSVNCFTVNASPIICSEGSAYDFVWDGWEGKLHLYPTSWNQSVLEINNTRYKVRQELFLDPQNYVAGRQGPGYLGVPSSYRHRIVLWIDFNRTPNDPKDDQRFEGYSFTQGGKPGFAGVVWWKDIPFGFYATNGMCIPG